MAAPQLPPSPVPTSEPLQGGNWRYLSSARLLRNVAGSGPFVGGNVSPFRIWTPSTRLAVCMTIGFRPDSAEDIGSDSFAAFALWTVNMDAWGRTDREAGGFLVRGNGILPGPFSLPNGLPLSYEATTGVDEWRGTVTVPSGGSGVSTTGDLWLTVAWEPEAGASNISEQALKTIFNECKIVTGNNPVVRQAVIG